MSRLAQIASTDSSIPAIAKVICDHSSMFLDEAKVEAANLVEAKAALREAVNVASKAGANNTVLNALVAAHVAFNNSLYASYGTAEVAELVNLECISQYR